MELEATWKRAFRVWFAYIWRNLIAIFASMAAGAIVGGILGLIMGMLGFSNEVVRIVVMPISVILGLAISIIPMKLILDKDYGEFRLVLLSNSDRYELSNLNLKASEKDNTL